MILNSSLGGSSSGGNGGKYKVIGGIGYSGTFSHFTIDTAEYGFSKLIAVVATPQSSSANKNCAVQYNGTEFDVNTSTAKLYVHWIAIGE